MYIRAIGNCLIGQLKNGNIIRTTANDGHILTEILNSAGKILKSRDKFIKKQILPEELQTVCKKAFPEHDNFTVTEVKRVVNVFDDSLISKSIRQTPHANSNEKTTVQFNVNMHISGALNGKQNVLLRESADVDNLFYGGVYESNFNEIRVPQLWMNYWAKRNIKLGYDDKINVPRNGSFLDSVTIPLRQSEYRGEWNRRIFMFKPEFPDFAGTVFGNDRVKNLKELIDISTYNPTKCYTQVHLPEWV